MALNFPSSPSTNDTYSYEGRTWTFNGNAWIQERFTSNLTLNISTAGNLIVGNTITSGDILPSANVTYNLGSETQRWNTIYLAGNTINLGGAQIKADPGEGTIALIPQVKSGEIATKAIVIGQQGIATVDTDSNGTVSTEAIQEAATNPNTTTTNMFVNSNAYITGNITTGNLITDSIFFSNGDPYVSGGGGASNVVIGTRSTPVYVALASSTTLDIVGRSSNVTVTLTT